MIIADTSYLYALLNERDSYHHAAASFAVSDTSTLIIPCVTLTELVYLVRRDFGYSKVPPILAEFAKINAQLAPLIHSDLRRIQEISSTYADARFDIVDCCIMALCERLDVRTVATFDHRDFSMFRPAHCEVLALKP